MTVSYAMLLDGGFIRHKLSTGKSHIDAAGISAFTTKVSQNARGSWIDISAMQHNGAQFPGS